MIQINLEAIDRDRAIISQKARVKSDPYDAFSAAIRQRVAKISMLGIRISGEDSSRFPAFED
ncbi:hypothetical protein E5S70_30010 [Ensifer adhaerens]|uniref:hypothetical protein n=1 Tax=Ensifer canadensis TaxID=555315 RepID=UPI00148FF18B|nr:hypothetical protein [Ensifer canadensis]NOV20243.1 hypothetical protein [Ensifer canadensis]